MAANDLQSVVSAVVKRARRQGHVTARDIRAELRMAGLADNQWKAVVAEAEAVLIHRLGRFYYKDSFTPRLQKEHSQQKAIHKVVRRLIQQHRRRTKKNERRGEARMDFVQPVQLRSDDGKECTVMSRDLSLTGIRLLGTRRLLGQKIEVALPTDSDDPPCRLLVRILWTCAVGDDLFENGGNFLELLA